MTISTQMLNDSIKKISETNSLLDMLCEFEKVIDDADVYAYKNWDKGEILEGPDLKRHFVNVKLLYTVFVEGTPGFDTTVGTKVMLNEPYILAPFSCVLAVVLDGVTPLKGAAVPLTQFCKTPPIIPL